MNTPMSIIVNHIYLHVLELLQILNQAVYSQEMLVVILVPFIFQWISIQIVRLCDQHKILMYHTISLFRRKRAALHPVE